MAGLKVPGALDAKMSASHPQTAGYAAVMVSEPRPPSLPTNLRWYRHEPMWEAVAKGGFMADCGSLT
jgi:hypothetical protein